MRPVYDWTVLRENFVSHFLDELGVFEMRRYIRKPSATVSTDFSKNGRSKNIADSCLYNRFPIISFITNAFAFR